MKKILSLLLTAIMLLVCLIPVPFVSAQTINADTVSKKGLASSLGKTYKFTFGENGDRFDYNAVINKTETYKGLSYYPVWTYTDRTGSATFTYKTMYDNNGENGVDVLNYSGDALAYVTLLTKEGTPFEVLPGKKYKVTVKAYVETETDYSQAYVCLGGNTGKTDSWQDNDWSNATSPMSLYGSEGSTNAESIVYNSNTKATLANRPIAMKGFTINGGSTWATGIKGSTTDTAYKIQKSVFFGVPENEQCVEEADVAVYDSENDLITFNIPLVPRNDLTSFKDVNNDGKQDIQVNHNFLTLFINGGNYIDENGESQPFSYSLESVEITEIGNTVPGEIIDADNVKQLENSLGEHYKFTFGEDGDRFDYNPVVNDSITYKNLSFFPAWTFTDKSAVPTFTYKTIYDENGENGVDVLNYSSEAVTYFTPLTKDGTPFEVLPGKKYQVNVKAYIETEVNYSQAYVCLGGNAGRTDSWQDNDWSNATSPMTLFGSMGSDKLEGIVYNSATKATLTNRPISALGFTANAGGTHSTKHYGTTTTAAKKINKTVYLGVPSNKECAEEEPVAMYDTDNDLITFNLPVVPRNDLSSFKDTDNDGKQDIQVNHNFLTLYISGGSYTNENGIKYPFSYSIESIEITEMKDINNQENYIGEEALTDKASTDIAAFGPVPSYNQYNYQKQELAAFLHFGINTFTGNEWGNGKDSVSVFNLTTPIDADGYVKAIKDAGFKKLIFTAKHHDGFCMWDSKYTEYDIAATNYPGDVLAEISAACTKYNIEMGLYLSPWDVNAESYGYYDKNGNPTTKENDYLDYNEYYTNQLIEIFSNDKYGCNGRFTEIWLDGAKGSGSDAQEYDFKMFTDVMREYEGIAAGYEDNPTLFGTDRRNIRWIGNEAGVANEQNWSKANATVADNSEYYVVKDQGGSVEYKGTTCAVGVKDGNVWMVPEVDARITSGWFWGPNKATPKTLEALKEMYLNTVGHNATLLLNVPLNNKGTLDDDIKNRVIEWGKNITESFNQNNLAAQSSVKITASEVNNNDIKFKPSNVVDSNDSTYWAASGSKQAALHFNFGKSVTFDAVTIEEAIQFGQRIEAFKIEYKNSKGEWVEFSSGTTIGAKRVVLEKAVTAKEARIIFTGMTSSANGTATPVISNVGFYKATKAFEKGSNAPEGIEEYDSADSGVFTKTTFETKEDYDCIGESYLSGNSGKTTEITFKGTLAWIIGTTDETETVISVSVDGKQPQNITLKSNTTVKGIRLFETETLADATHKIEIVVVSGTAKIDGIYVLNNGGKGMLDFEYDRYTVGEDSSLNIKVTRKGGSIGALSAIVQDNPGSAVQSSYHTTEGLKVTFLQDETEKQIVVRTKRYTEKTGTLSFTLEIVDDNSGVITGFNSPTSIFITDADEYIQGDVDGNGAVNAADLATLKKVIAGLIPIDSEEVKYPDVNGDGGIPNAADLATLKKKIAGLE